MFYLRKICYPFRFLLMIPGKGDCIKEIMKKNFFSILMIVLVAGLFPVASFAQVKPSLYNGVDSSKIPPHLRYQNWDDSTTAKKLENVVVVAYGAQKKSSVTGAVAQLSEKQIAKRPITNIAEALTGSAPGIQSTLSGGQPGGSPNIRVRGFGSISAGSSPLIVVDGIVYDGDLASINTSDVASMTTLMDASSAALYGSRGSNGVILVTTKKRKQ